MSRATAAPGGAGLRGFTLSHQKVALELSFAGSAAGYTQLTVVPNSTELRTIHLNCRQAAIHRITVDGHAAEYSFVDHLANLGLSDPRDVHLYPELKRKLYAAASDGSGGELSVLIPPEVTIKPVPVEEAAPAGTIDAPTPGGTALALSELSPLVVHIEYSLRSPSDGIHFLLPTEEDPYRAPQLYTTPSCADWPRCWVPCVDSLWERCTWELEFVVPRMLTSDEEQDGDDEHGEVLVVCSGDLMEKVVHPHNSSKAIFYYAHSSPTSVHHISFAAGPFEMLDVAKLGRAAEDTTSNSSTNTPQMLAFCLPGRMEELRNSVGVVRQAMEFYSKDFGSYPFASFKVVFVDDTLQDAHHSSTMTLCSSDLLHPSSVVEQALETRHVLSHAVAFQYIGINIIQRSWADTWLVHGISLYITGLFLRRLLGNNEYRFRLKKDCDRLCAWDMGMPPLYQSGAVEPPDRALLPFINLKAPLILHILDRRLCKVGATLGLGRVIPKVFLQAITGEMPNGSLSTSSFLRTCRKVSGVDLKQFASQWIFGSGCPRFHCSAAFNRKKLIIEFTIKQESPGAQFAAAHPDEAINSNPIQLFEGQMTVRIHEADGTPYEHVFDINQASRRFEVPFNTKYKRVRRNTKRFQARQAAAAAAAEGDEDAAEAVNAIDLGFGLGMWEEEEQRQRWQVADWTAEDEDIMSTAPYEWIRMDADFEWIAEVHFDQPDFMWVSQLQRDRDVVAQVAAVHALSQLPNAVSSSMLTRTVLVPKYFYRVRTEAAQALVACAVPQLEYLGFFHLLMLFRTRFCHELPDDVEARTSLDVPCIPRANDFADVGEYFLRKALVQAISCVRNEHGRTLPQVKTFLINLLRYNDNSTNRVTDAYYLAAVIEALGAAFTPLDSPVHGLFVPAHEDPDARDDDRLLLEARLEIDRYQELDKLVSSYHNVITLACINWHTTMTLSNMVPVDLQMLFAYTREGTYAPVRVAAFEALLLLRGLQHKVLARYMLAVLRLDASRIVKRALARGLCESLVIALGTGAARGEAALIEDAENAMDPDGAKEAMIDAGLKAVKREIGRSAAVREGFLAALLAPGNDGDVRWALLKLAESLFKAGEEREVPFQPKVSVRVRLPSTATASDQVAAAAGADVSMPAAATKIKLVRSGTDAAPRVSFVHPAEALAAAPTAKAPRAKKPKPAQPAQASGMSSADLTACRNCLRRLQESKNSVLFRLPVDPVRDNAPGYFQLIKEPMDLSSISNKLDAGLYRDRFDFKADFELMMRNARTYTPDPHSYVHKEATKLEAQFNTIWNRITRTLEQAAAKHAKAHGQAIDPPAVEQGNEQAETGVAAVEAAVESATETATQDAPAPAPAPTPTSMPPPPAPVAPAAVAPAPTPLEQQPAKKGLKLKFKLKAPEANPEATSAEPSHEPAPPPTPARSQSPAKAPKTPKVKVAKTPKPTDASPDSLSSMSASPEVPLASLQTSPIAAKAKPKAKAKAANGSSDPVVMGGDEPVHLHTRQCKELLQQLKKMKEAFFFLRPVDPVLDGLPTYYDEIPREEAMDLGTMEKKLSSGAYETMGDFAADMMRIFNNCRTFNPPTTEPYEFADAVEAAFVKAWPKALVRKLENKETRALQSLLAKLKESPTANLFLFPVDPVALGIPTYFDVIKPEDARDLSLIGRKLKEGAYDSIDAFDDDVRLMLHNCLTFNAGNDEVCDWARSFERVYERGIADARTSTGHPAKRKAGGGGGSSSKKAKKA